VLELGQLLAGPFAGFLLAGFGAEVIKVEPPGEGDPLRRWRKLDEGGTSLWWRSLARDKKCVTADLRVPEGRALVKRLIERGVDVVIENFRPGRLEAWGLGPDDLWAIDPRIVIVRISGYGQTGPKASAPGFANVAEAVGGLRYTTGEPDRPPVRAGISLGDSLAGLHAAFGTLAAIHERDRSGRGQVVDCSLAESVFSVMESLLPEYDRLGFVRERSGTTVPGIAPSNTYACTDGWVVLGANNDSLFVRLMKAIDREDLAEDPALAHNDGRVREVDRIDAAISAWSSSRTVAEALAVLERAEVPSGPIQSIADIASDPQFIARGMLERLPLADGTTLAMPRIVPLLSRTPATSERAGPELGADNESIYGELGIGPAELADLHARGIV
jgi:succinyl-CoA---D-citramalate CoA-transferase